MELVLRSTINQKTLHMVNKASIGVTKSVFFITRTSAHLIFIYSGKSILHIVIDQSS